MRITAPNYTQTPNDLADHWLPFLSGVETKVLVVIMRKTLGWHKKRDRISMSQLEKLTGCQEKAIATAIKSLIKKGLIAKFVDGPKGIQSTYYELIVQEDSNSYEPPAFCGGNPPHFAGGTPRKMRDTKETPPKETSKETTTKKKKEQAAPVVAVSFDKDGEKKKETAKPKIHECLESLDEKDVPMKEKLWLNKKYDEETVKNAILWAQHPSTRISTTLIATIKWACVEKPQMPKNAVDQKEANRIYAMNYDGEKSGGVKIEAENAYVSFTWITPCSSPCDCFRYDEKGFMDKFEQKLIQRKFPILR